VPPAAAAEIAARPPIIAPTEPTFRAAEDIAERAGRPAALAAAANDPSSPPIHAVIRGPLPQPIPPPAAAPGRPQRVEPPLPIVADALPAPPLPQIRTVERVTERASDGPGDAEERPPRKSRVAPPIRLEPPAAVPPPRPADEGGVGGVRIGSLEVRIVSPPAAPAPAGHPPVVPVPAAQPVHRQTAPLSRGFRSFGLAQG